MQMAFVGKTVEEGWRGLPVGMGSFFWARVRFLAGVHVSIYDGIVMHTTILNIY
jgi:hypothetical protein